ncbi:MAG: MarR family transcriptional regulator [Bacteroidia bacterium]|nr:MarR family transcriptional regulator [Bacteroidia bacterium]
MKTKKILIELIELLDEFESEREVVGQEMNMSDFLGFLNSKNRYENIKTKQLKGDYAGYKYEETDGPVTDISILIVLMFRYAKGYIKKALRDSAIKTADEFSFLMTLMTYESLSKSELIQKQVMEKTSGTEIINRMIKMGLIESFNDETDKRSVRVKMTPAGRMEIIKILPEMQKVSKIVTGNLNETEKNTMAYMLRKLEHYHNDIFMNKKESELEELI